MAESDRPVKILAFNLNFFILILCYRDKTIFMIDFTEYTKLNEGKRVLISTTTGTVNGTLSGSKADGEGNIVALVVKQYLHRIDVPTSDILNIRVV